MKRSTRICWSSGFSREIPPTTTTTNQYIVPDMVPGAGLQRFPIILICVRLLRILALVRGSQIRYSDSSTRNVGIFPPHGS